MADGGEITIKIKLLEEEVKKGLKAIGEQAKNMAKDLSIGFATKSFDVLKKGILATTGALTVGAGMGMKYNAELEGYATNFKTMLGGSKEAADKLVASLREMDVKTPFDVSQLAKAQETMMGFGIQSDKAKQYLQMIGDVSGGNAEKLQGLSLAFSQVQSAGKLTGQDLIQMINQGFNPLNEISKNTGKSMAQLKDEMSKGQISAEMVADAFKTATSEGGMFYNSMEAQSKTFSGQMSTLQGNFQGLLGQLSTGLTNSVTGDILPTLNNMLGELSNAFGEGGFGAFIPLLGEKFTELVVMLANKAPEIIQLIVELVESIINTLIEKAPELLTAGANILENIVKGASSILPKFTELVTELFTGFVSMILDNLPQILQCGIDIIIKLAEGLTKALPELIPKAIDCILKIVDTLFDNMDKIIDAGINLIISLAEGLINALPKLIEKVPLIATKLFMAFINMQFKLSEAGVKLMISLIGGLVKVFPQIISAVIGLPGSIANAITQGIFKITEAGRHIIEGLWNGINNAKQWVLDKIKGFGGAILDGIKSFFGIHSPSRVMRDKIGVFLAQGIGVGFEEEIDSVYNQMKKEIDYNNEKIKGNVSSTLHTTYENEALRNEIKQLDERPITVITSVELDGEKVGESIEQRDRRKDLVYGRI